MFKLILVLIFLSVDAQRLKLFNDREEIRIPDVSDVEKQQETVSYRLPNNTRPELYLLSLNLGQFYDEDLSFSGNVLITIRVLENTDTIVIHSAVLVINTFLFTDKNVPISHTVDYDSKREFMTVKTNYVLEKDSFVRFDVKYTGTIGSSIAGVYRGSYLNDENIRR